MSILNQKTINANVTFEGVGLHTGKKVSVKDIGQIEPKKTSTYKAKTAIIVPINNRL